MSIASLNGHIITRARVQVPAWGIWWIDCDLADETDLSGTVTCAIADKTFHGVVMSGGSSPGKSAYRIIGGRGGWHHSVIAKAFIDDAGVKVSTVAADLARIVGEDIADVPATRRGPHYARQAGLASLAMHELAPRSWYVDFDGVTHFGARPSVAYAGTAPRVEFDRAIGVAAYATEEIGALVPGVVVPGLIAATDVEYELDAKRLTVRVYSNAPTTRRLDALRRIFDALDPRRVYRGTFEFRVVTQDGERLNLQPVRVSSGLSDLPLVPVRLSPGVRAKHQLGSIVLVAFADGDPSRPQVVSGDAADAPGWMPDELDFGPLPRLGVARETDPVTCGAFVGTINPNASRVKAGK
jgi:hypothetical protein